MSHVPNKFRCRRAIARAALAALLSAGVLCAGLGAAAAGGLGGTNKQTDLDRLLHAFEIIAFGSETKAVAERSLLLKWSRARIPVNFSWIPEIDDRGPRSRPAHPAWREKAWAHLKALQKITGLVFEDSISKQKRPLISVVFTPRHLLGKIPIPGVGDGLQRELAAPGGCYFVAFRGSDQALERAVIVVNAERGIERIDHCLLEELTQALGLPNDTDLIRPSIFSDNDRLLKLSQDDTVILQTLYHRDLTSGMARPQAIALARLIIGELLAARH